MVMEGHCISSYMSVTLPKTSSWYFSKSPKDAYPRQGYLETL